MQVVTAAPETLPFQRKKPSSAYSGSILLKQNLIQALLKQILP